MSVTRYRELIDSCVAGDVADTTPAAFWRHQPVADQDAPAMAEATLDFQRRFDSDLVKLTPASSYQLRDHGMSDRWTGDVVGRRIFGAPIATDAAAWCRIADRTSFAHREVQLHAAAAVRAATPHEVPVVATVFSPGFQARTLAGAAFTAQHERFPSELAAALDALTTATRGLIADYLDAGVDAIFYAVQHATAEATTEDEYRSVDLPHDLLCLDQARGGRWTIVHLHGTAVHAGLVEAWQPDILHYDETATGLSLDVIGGPGQVVATGPGSLTDPLPLDPKAVTRLVRDLRDRSVGRPFMLAPGCALPLDTAPELVDAALAAARTVTS